jgi:hypothetical protein
MATLVAWTLLLRMVRPVQSFDTIGNMGYQRSRSRASSCFSHRKDLSHQPQAAETHNMQSNASGHRFTRVSSHNLAFCFFLTLAVVRIRERQATSLRKNHSRPHTNAHTQTQTRESRPIPTGIPVRQLLERQQKFLAFMVRGVSLESAAAENEASARVIRLDAHQSRFPQMLARTAQDV